MLVDCTCNNFRHPGSFLCASEIPKTRDNESLWYKAFYSAGPNSKERNNSINLIIDDIDKNREIIRVVDSNIVTCNTKIKSFTHKSSMVHFNVVKGRNTSLPELKYCDEGQFVKLVNKANIYLVYNDTSIECQSTFNGI